jgi:hypothetical protein
MKTKLSTAKGDYFFEDDYKVVIPYKNVSQILMSEWCQKNLKGECITGRGPTNSSEMISWYFEYKADAMLFALRWS